MSKIAYNEPKRWNGQTKQLLETIEKVVLDYLSEGYSLTLRQLYYQLVSKNIISNSESEYKKIGRILKDARMAGIIDWDAIEDHGRIPNIPTQFDNLDELFVAAVNSYHVNRWVDQPYYVEVWCEKDALTSILEPITRKYQVPLIIDRGYSSVTAMQKASVRIHNNEYRNDKWKHPYILYLGDHDPSGLDMERDIEDRLREFRCEPTIIRVALTTEQTEKYQLPPNPAKITDPRAKEYFEEFGNESWELDALEPSLLSSMLESEIRNLLDVAKYDKAVESEKLDLEQFRKRWLGNNK